MALTTTTICNLPVLLSIILQEQGSYKTTEPPGPRTTSRMRKPQYINDQHSVQHPMFSVSHLIRTGWMTNCRWMVYLSTYTVASSSRPNLLAQQTLGRRSGRPSVRPPLPNPRSDRIVQSLFKGVILKLNMYIGTLANTVAVL